MATHHLRRSIFIVVTTKVIIVLCAAFFVYGPRERPHIDGDSVRAQLLGTSNQ